MITQSNRTQPAQKKLKILVPGDRTLPTAYDSLKGRNWDIVIDNGAAPDATLQNAAYASGQK